MTPDLRLDGYETDTEPTHSLIAKTGKAIFKKTDVSSSQDVEALIASAVAEYSRLDMYVDARISFYLELDLSKTGSNAVKLG